MDLEISKIEKDLKSELESKLTKESRVTEIIDEPPIVPTKPTYDILHKSTPTNHLVVEIELPLLDTISGLDLDVTRKMLSIHHDKYLYELEVLYTIIYIKIKLFLPFEVDEDSTKAQFDKTKHILTVYLNIREGA
jgi:HSP20 family molecular chaperone IbpA